MADADGSGIVQQKYIRGIGLLASKNSQGQTTGYLFNAHGDVVQLTDSSGNVTRRYDYDAFGVEKPVAGNPTGPDGNPFRYCGEYFDAETGSVYLRARYYDPRTGRFGAEDPIRDGLNWYTYCGNNPISFVDPRGLSRMSLEAYLLSNEHLDYISTLDRLHYDPLVQEQIWVQDSYQQDWFGTYRSPYSGYEGIEITYNFKLKALLISESLGINPDDLMTVMAVESKIATRMSPYGGRAGLLQFVGSTADLLGYSLDDLAAMDGLQQLDVVHQFFQLNLNTYKQADPGNLIDLYSLMLAPGYGGFGQSDDYVIIPQSNKYYSGNSAMDMDGVNGITRGDLRSWINYQMDEYRKYVG